MSRLRRCRILVSLLLAAAAACGSSGGGNSATVTQHLLALDGPAGQNVVLVFADGPQNSYALGNIVAFDANASAPVPMVIESRDAWSQYLGSFAQTLQDSAAGTSEASPIRTRVLAYLKHGRITVIDDQRSSGLPQPRVVSALSIGQMCRSEFQRRKP